MSDARFPPVTRAQWQAKASKDLKGRPLASLTRTTAEGLAIAPLYMADDAVDGRAALPRPPGGGWASVQSIEHADPEAANEAARADIALGADGVMFVLDGELQAGRERGRPANGLVLDPHADLPTLLAGIDPGQTKVYFQAGVLAAEVADAYELWLDEREDEQAEAAEGVRPGASPATGGVVYDPITPLLTTGGLELGFEAALAGGVDRVLGMEAGLFGVSTVPYHDAGAGDADELALALAACAEVLRRCEGQGLEPGDLAPQLMWTLPLAGRPFEAIAKLRAARGLWARFAAACGLEGDDRAMWIHATSSTREWTRVGPWVNLLRGTIGTFAAAVGGADSIATAAFDGLCGPEGDAVVGTGRGSPQGRRLALNTQVILREESHLGRVIDPAGGSWFVESLTDTLARAAWDRFRAIERDGGLVAGLTSGAIQRAIADTSKARLAAVARRQRAITGVSTFAVLDEQPTPRQPPNEFAGDGPERHRAAPTLEPAEIPALPRVRLAAEFEALRDASESGARPRVATINLGSLAEYQARADFAANLFRAGGFEVVEVEPEAFAASGTDLAVICGRDEAYAERASDLVAALRSAGARIVWIAGRPPDDDPDAWGEARTIHRGCDALAALRAALGEEA